MSIRPHVVLVVLALAALVACDTVGIKRSYMALDANGARRRHTFYTDTDAIYCITEMASGVDDVSVAAKVRAQSLFDPVSGARQRLPHEAVIGAEEQAPGRGMDLNLSFHLLKPDGEEVYPAGEFVCELYVDGKLSDSLEFEVKYPSCPFKPIKAMSTCTGAVLYGSECPSPLGANCVCSQETDLWQCE